jgi:hypothetical protein
MRFEDQVIPLQRPARSNRGFANENQSTNKAIRDGAAGLFGHVGAGVIGEDDRGEIRRAAVLRVDVRGARYGSAADLPLLRLSAMPAGRRRPSWQLRREYRLPRRRADDAAAMAGAATLDQGVPVTLALRSWCDDTDALIAHACAADPARRRRSQLAFRPRHDETVGVPGQKLTDRLPRLRRHRSIRGFREGCRPPRAA